MFSYFTALFLAGLLPATLLVYATVPQRRRWIVLLFASYGFFAMISGGLLVFLVVSTLSVYVAARALGSLAEGFKKAAKENPSLKAELKARCKKRQKLLLAVVILFNLAILAILKYLGFFGEVLGSVLSLFGVEFTFIAPQIGIPIGISFYTLMAVSYCVDVFRGTIKPDPHFGRVALFLSFFAQIMEGPICRYEQTAAQLYAGKQLEWNNLYQGSLRLLVGLAKKLIIADRLNIFVKNVFDGYSNYDGGIILVGAVLYTIQLYFDFSGTMDVALGIARMFNVTLPENFRQPFFSRTASEFWKRWHITLGAWLRDYVYYPVSLSKPCKRITKRSRKVFGNRYGSFIASSLALFCVWFANGIWHGSGSQYLFFGMYYFVLIVAGGLIEPMMASFAQKHHINRNSFGYRGFQIARTCVIIVVGELFFRANGLDAGLSMFGSIFTDFSVDAFCATGIGAMGLSLEDWIIAILFVSIFLAFDVVKELGHSPLSWVSRQNGFVKWAVWTVVFCSFVVFGAYGYGYVPVDPMYAQF